MIEAPPLTHVLGRAVMDVRSAPFAYATSHRIDELLVTFGDGTHLELLRKSLATPELAAGRPAWVVDPHRELAAYQLLADAGLGNPACLGIDGEWLLLEKVDGIPLWQAAGAEGWINAARWLAALHARFARNTPPSDHLAAYDARYFRSWPDRACRLHPEVTAFTSRYERVVDILTTLPVTFVHGEFYPSNVMVDGKRIAPVDWEMAGIGPGVLDLAALVTGWAQPQRDAIISAYGNVSPEALSAAEVHLAMQWLGWAAGWVPPAEHARDWLAELGLAAERLEL